MLLNEATGERLVLRALHVFGRNAPRSDTYLSDPEVSLMHATVRWWDEKWVMTDHSRNGTFLDGRFLPKGQWVTMKLGQKFQFGSQSGSVWRIVDLSAPATSLIPIDSELEQIVLKNCNLLPNSEAPELSIYQTVGDQWMLETPGEARVLEDGDTLSLGGHSYRLLVTGKLDETQINTNSLPLELPHFNFVLSLDEEHTQSQIRFGSVCVDLGEREHHYCLVTLARQRLADARAGIEPSAQGWLECTELAKMLGLEIQHLNIQIFRARNQIMKLLPGNTQLANIIERRRGSIRLGAFPFDIVRGSQLESQYKPEPPTDTGVLAA